jgi:gliding motility-associated-like protein
MINYQWQKLNTTSSLFVNITDTEGYSGTTTSTLTIDTNGDFGAGEYRCHIFANLAADKFSNSATVSIIDAPGPVVTNVSSCTSASLTLNATGGADGDYRWYTTPTEGTNIPGEVNGDFTTPVLDATTSYYVAIVNPQCESIRSELIVAIGGPGCADEIIVYNGISPNGDIYNEKWVIQNIELLPDTRENKVSIYNRWGDLVFEIENYDNDTRVFSGINKNGDEVSSGVYFYKIEFLSGKKPLLGYLNVKQ